MTRRGLLMLDEPSQGIMPKLVDEIFQAVKRIPRRHDGCLIRRASQAECPRNADRAYILQPAALLIRARPPKEGGGEGGGRDQRQSRRPQGVSRALCVIFAPLVSHHPYINHNPQLLATSSTVIPAKAGIHNLRIYCLHAALTPACAKNAGQWLWVPAFAGRQAKPRRCCASA